MIGQYQRTLGGQDAFPKERRESLGSTSAGSLGLSQC